MAAMYSGWYVVAQLAHHVVEDVDGLGGNPRGGAHGRRAAASASMIGAEDEPVAIDQEQPGTMLGAFRGGGWWHPESGYAKLSSDSATTCENRTPCRPWSLLIFAATDPASVLSDVRERSVPRMNTKNKQNPKNQRQQKLAAEEAGSESQHASRGPEVSRSGTPRDAADPLGSSASLGSSVMAPSCGNVGGSLCFDP